MSPSNTPLEPPPSMPPKAPAQSAWSWPAGIEGLPPSRWIELEGGPVHYVEWDGSPATTFVLIHGLGGSHVNWVSVGSRLAERGRVVALDLAGFGFTPRAGRSSAMQANRRLLGRFLQEVPLRNGGRTILVGNSMGGGLSILQAAIEPSSVDAIVLSSSIVPWARGGWPAPQVVGAFVMYRLPGVGLAAGRIRMSALDPERIVRTGFKMTTARPSAIDPEVVRIHVDMARIRAKDPDAPPAFIEAARSLLRLGRRPQIARAAMDAVSCPVLMMHGAKDKLVPVEYADAAAAREPLWRYRRFPDLGHVMQVEAAERWLEAVGGWLDENDL